MLHFSGSTLGAARQRRSIAAGPIHLSSSVCFHCKRVVVPHVVVWHASNTSNIMSMRPLRYAIRLLFGSFQHERLASRNQHRK